MLPVFNKQRCIIFSWLLSSALFPWARKFYSLSCNFPTCILWLVTDRSNIQVLPFFYGRNVSLCIFGIWTSWKCWFHMRVTTAIVDVTVAFFKITHLSISIFFSINYYRRFPLFLTNSAVYFDFVMILLL